MKKSVSSDHILRYGPDQMTVERVVAVVAENKIGVRGYCGFFHLIVHLLVENRALRAARHLHTESRL